MSAPSRRPSQPAWSRRTVIGLAVLALLAAPAWVALDRWRIGSASGWPLLAAHYAAGDRPLTGSRGLTTVTLEAPGRPTTTFRRRRQGSFMELGLDDDGFWLRSYLSQPQPALYIPWTAVRRCFMFSAWVAWPGAAGSGAAPDMARFTVYDDAFEQACTAHVARTGEAQR